MRRNKFGLGVLSVIAISAMISVQANAQTFDFNDNTAFDGGQGMVGHISDDAELGVTPVGVFHGLCLVARRLTK